MRPLLRTSVFNALSENPPALTNRILSRFLTIGAGFALEKADLFPTEASRGAAQVVLVSNGLASGART